MLGLRERLEYALALLAHMPMPVSVTATQVDAIVGRLNTQNHFTELGKFHRIAHQIE